MRSKLLKQIVNSVANSVGIVVVDEHDTFSRITKDTISVELMLT